MSNVAQPLLSQCALVTGASRGIGKSAALALASAGADVIVNYNSNPAGAEAVVAEIQAMGRKAVAIQADVSDSQAVGAMFDRIALDFPALTILVNNAGIQTWKPLLDLTESEWERVIDVN